MSETNSLVSRLEAKAAYTDRAFNNASLGGLYLEAAAEIARLQEEVRGLAGFAKVALAALWDGSDLDGSDIQDAALQHGLIVQTAFDPNVHTDHLGVGVNPGDEWFVPAPWLATLQGQQS